MCKKLAFSISLILLLGLVNSASGNSYSWTGDGSGDSWCTPENWDPVGVPGPADDAIIDEPNKPCVIDCDVTCYKLTVGLNNAGCSLDMVSGSLSVGTDLTVGKEAGSSGTMCVSDSSVVTVDGHIEIGGPDCIAQVVISDSGVINTHTFGMCTGGGVGTVDISGGDINVTTDMDIGGSGDGTVNMTGGTISCGGNMAVPGVDEGRGILNMVGSAVTVGGHLEIGGPMGSAGAVNKSGGTVHVGGNVDVVRGYFVNSDTTVTVDGHLEIWDGGSGAVGLYGGVISTHTFGMQAGGSSTMEIGCDGVLTVDGDATAQITGYVSDGWIMCSDSECSQVAIDYDNVSPGRTTVYCILACGQAWNPNPADAAVCVEQDVTLSWSPGDYATSHDVYLGADFDDVDNATPGAPAYMGRQDPNSYEPGALQWCTEYFWRIDEVCSGGLISKGEVWSFTTMCDYCCIKPPPNMRAWWPLDETVGNTSEELVYGNDGDWMGTPVPSVPSGKVDGALYLSGSSYVRVKDDWRLDFGTADFSIDCWVRTTTTDRTLILDKRSGTISNPKGYLLYLTDGNLTLQLSDGTGGARAYGSTLYVADGQWRHVAATVDRGDQGTVVLYVGGVPSTFGMSGWSGNVSNDADVWFGRDRFGIGSSLTGDIDEVELFSRALTPAEVKAIFDAGSAGKCKCKPAPAYRCRSDVKWAQPPVRDYMGCIDGWDELSVYDSPPRPFVADDWFCRTDKAIKGIHWWGSFKGWTEPNRVPPDDMPATFHIGIWTDVPDPDPNDPDTFSHPGELVWEKISDCYVWNYAGCDLDPRQINETDSCFRFEQFLSEDEWFHQDPNGESGTVYWLSIGAIYDGAPEPDFPWGWKTRPHFYHDDAVRKGFGCLPDCPDPELSVFQAGEVDDFNLPTEPAYPSQELIDANLYAPGYGLRDFDEITNDKPFGHTFTGLPPCIVAAELEIRMKTCGSLALNDVLLLELVNPSAPPHFAWSKGIRYLPLVPLGTPIGSWTHPHTATFTLNLDALVGGVSILKHLKDGDLDVYVSDDTAVDYIILRVWTCPEGWFWETGEPIEYPAGTSWDMAFVLTANREYRVKRRWPPWFDVAADTNYDEVINFKDIAIVAEGWLVEAVDWDEGP